MELNARFQAVKPGNAHSDNAPYGLENVSVNSPHCIRSLPCDGHLVPDRNMLRFPGRKQAGRIEDERQLRCNMYERGQQRIEITGCGQTDADRIDDQRAVEILQDNAATAFGHANGLNELHASLPINTTSALSRATSVPASTATPTVASLRACASLMPSPSMATTLPSRTCSAICAVFCSGRRLA